MAQIWYVFEEETEKMNLVSAENAHEAAKIVQQRWSKDGCDDDGLPTIYHCSPLKSLVSEFDNMTGYTFDDFDNLLFSLFDNSVEVNL